MPHFNSIITLYEGLFKKSHIRRAEKSIEHFEKMDEQARQAVRGERLLHMLRRAHDEVPYFRNLFERRGLRFNDLRALEKFSEIPILGREELRNNFDTLQNKNKHKMRWVTSRTSGSTGEPRAFLIDREYEDIKQALRYHQYRNNGWKEGDTLVKIWGTAANVDDSSTTLKRKIGNWLRKRIEVNSLIMTESIMAEMAQKIQSQKSVFIEAYAQSAYELARFINENQIEIRNVSGVTTSVSTLHDFMRPVIETAFNCRVYNRYGSREASVIAFEKQPGEGLEVSTSQYIVEVIGENGAHCKPGEEGDIVLTSFSNFVFPFIRYRIGDRAVVRTLEERPVTSCIALENISGRISDKFLREDGSYVDSSYFSILIGHLANSGWVEKMQVVQQDYHKVQVKIIKKHGLEMPESARALIQNGIQKAMGAKCLVEINLVEEIEPLPSGKFQYITSKINQRESKP